MKNYDQFITNKNNQQINEGFFDVFKKLVGKITGYFNKIKGGKEVKVIYDKYITLINNEFKKQANVDLNIGAEQIKKESIVYDYKSFINEELEQKTDDTDVSNLLGGTTGTTSGTTTDNKMTVDTLKKKTAILDKIIALYVDKAMKEMSAVLQKYGGAEKNPKLKVIIDNQKDQFTLDYLEAKILYLEKAGDKTIINQMKVERDKLSKDLNNRWNSFDEAGNVKEGGQLLVGVYYRYNTDEGIKTIKMVKQSPNNGKIIATYVFKDDGQIKDQDFDTKNIDTVFVPVTGTTYNYYSETNKGIVKVKIDKYDPLTKQVDVTSEKGNKFKAHVGALRDVVTETPTTPTQQTTTDQTTTEQPATNATQNTNAQVQKPVEPTTPTV